MTSTTKEIVWLYWLFTNVRVFLSYLTPMYCNNQSSIQIVYSSIFHEQTKHIEIDCCLTRHEQTKHKLLMLILVIS